jgi:hypothetical protein
MELTVLDLFTYYWWRPYLAYGRSQLRVGIQRRRRDRIEPEYRWVGLDWQL